MLCYQYKRRRSALSLKQPTSTFFKKVLQKNFENTKSLPSLYLSDIDENPASLPTPKKVTPPPNVMTNSQPPKMDGEGIPQPIADPEVPLVVHSISTRFSTSQNIIEFTPIPDLPKIGDSNFAEIFEQKCNTCSIPCDYSNPQIDSLLKASVKIALTELINLLSNNSCRQMTAEQIQMLYKMLNFNIFRELPDINVDFLPVEAPPIYLDNSFERLEMCYTILRSMIMMFNNDNYFPPEFTKKLIQLLLSPNTNEHNCIIQCVLQYYNSFPARQHSIVHEIYILVQDYRDQVISPFCVCPCLFLLYRIYKPILPNLNTSLYQELHSNVLPLVLTKHLPWFYEPLQHLLVLLSNYCSCNSVFIITFLIHFFPRTTSPKQIAFLNILIALNQNLNTSDFNEVVVPLYKLIASCSMNTNCKVMETALKIWQNQKIVAYIIDKSKIIFPIVYPAISEVSRSFWNSAIQNTALSVLTKMHDIDPFVYDELNTKHVKAAPQKQKISQQKRWAYVARIAAFYDRDFDLFKKLTEIQYTFNSESPLVSMSATGTGDTGKRAVLHAMKKNTNWR
ncbi:phosphoprotein phosphatase [Tritrichomonas foetus]|uniref:Phosphoprotein phosphatase n=1 Tax=Tritrichomonas foetus TaxID=1144522 RepID=A0A1J4KT67_9EUKA|nr:phosphoprotein phosphatase [Tritrichomonas foetus]|eukprot:OHT12854.1 phosphoprotein phosphatase [Tritrichomonas foetus]